LRQYLMVQFEYDVRDISTLVCKTHTFLTYTFLEISSYILVALTLNRFRIIFNLNMIFKPKKISNKPNDESIRSVVWIVSMIILVILLLNGHFLIFYELTEPQNKATKQADNCTINVKEHKDYYYFRMSFYSRMYLYLFIVVPCCILFIMNLLIIKKIMSPSKSIWNKMGRANEVKQKEKKRTALSIMLVAVCLWFMILKTPASVYVTYPANEKEKPIFPFKFSLIMLINYTNHAINLILYIATSSGFRDEFKEFFLDLNKRIFTFKKQRIPSSNNQQPPHLKQNKVQETQRLIKNKENVQEINL
jgi:hypothetical protein